MTEVEWHRRLSCDEPRRIFWRETEIQAWWMSSAERALTSYQKYAFINGSHLAPFYGTDWHLLVLVLAVGIRFASKSKI